MKRRFRLVVAFCLTAALLSTTAARAVVVKSGPAVGRPLPQFFVTKCGGAPEDGVALKNELCYRTRYGSRPMTIVFTSRCDDKLETLAKQLDAAVKEHEAAEFAAFICVLGPDRQEAERRATTFCAKVPTANVPIVVPYACEKGPQEYMLNPKADVTVLTMFDDKLAASYGGDIHEGSLTKIMGDIGRAARNAIGKAAAAKAKAPGKDATVKSGPQVEQFIQPYSLQKVGGRPIDAVPVGTEIDYRDRYAGRPCVIVFTRKIDEQLTNLVKELDAAVAQDQTKQLRALVNILGAPREAAIAQAKEFAAKAPVTNVVVGVPFEFENGPYQYALNPEVETTILVCLETWVTANFAGPIDEKVIKAVQREIMKLPSARNTLRLKQERQRALARQPDPLFKNYFFFSWFDGTKIGGAPDDGIAVGSTIDYLRRHAEQDYRGPTIVVFARAIDDQLTAFMAKLDEAVAKNEDRRLHATLNFIGDDLEAVKKLAKTFADEHPLKKIPVVVPAEYDNGPERHLLDVRDQYTVVFAAADGTPKLLKGIKPNALPEFTSKRLLEDLLELVQ